ncbi:hypothetical protein QVN49_12230, partial [Megasphaera hexanoica]|nr:hypothetical protein [Megasphaera hexanoica]
MKLKKARSTAAILAVMALTAGFSSVYAAGPLDINVNGELESGEKVHSMGRVQSKDIAMALENESLHLD